MFYNVVFIQCDYYGIYAIVFQIDIELVLLIMRFVVEKQLNLIVVGKAYFEDVLKYVLNIFCLKFKYFVENIGGMDELFEVIFFFLVVIGKLLFR